MFEKDAAFLLIVVRLKQAVKTKKADISETGQQGPGKTEKHPEGTIPPFALSLGYVFAMAVAFCMNAM